MTHNRHNEHIKELEDLASRVLATKKATRPRRPIVLEFCGTPKSGKTSCLSSLNLFLKRNEFATKLLAERAGVCPISDKFSPVFNIWTSNSTIAELSAAFAEHGKNLDVIMCDRGIFDALCWFEWLLQHDHMKERDYRALTCYLTTDRLRAMIDLVYVLKVSPQEAMVREYAHLLTRKHGSIMNPTVLEEFNESIGESVGKFAPAFRRVKTIDTSELLQNDVSHQVTLEVLKTLHELLVERVGYFKRQDLAKQFGNKTHWRLAEFDPVPELCYGPRDEVEDDVSLVQPVPIVVVTNKAHDRVLVVKKKATSTSRDSPERDRLLAYLGGHIRTEDNMHGPHEDIKSISSATLSREIQEELSLSLTISDEDPLCIWVRNNARSEAHLALVYLYEVDFDHLAFKLDEYEFVQKTGKSRSGRILPVADLRIEDMEDWSRIILTQKVRAGLQLSLFDTDAT